jgi:hypothetical protein
VSGSSGNYTISVTGITGGLTGSYLPLSGGTVTGGTIFTSGITANTISNTTYIRFNTGTTITPTVEGEVFFDNVEHALSYNTSINQGVKVNLGQQNYLRVFNISGVEIPRGKVLEILSSHSGLPSVTLAINKHTGFNLVGVSAENIPDGSEGIVITNGIISDIQLTGMTVGSLVYASDTTPGDYVSKTLFEGFPLTARTNSVGYVIQTGETTGKLFVNIVNENSTLSLTDLERNVLEGNTLSTGAFEYTGATTASTTTFNVAPLKGWIVKNTYTYALTPDVQSINYSGGTNISVTNIASADSTYILINSGSTITQQVTFPTPQQRRENIFLGKINHPNRTSILNINQTVDYDVSPMSSLRDLWSPIKLINQGIIPSPNGANLSFNTSAGTLWGNGINWAQNQLSPNNVSISAKVPVSFNYRTQTGGTSTSVTVIDPTKYDVGGAITSIGNANLDDATNQRIYLYPTGVINVLYGQTKYVNLASAVAAVQSEVFIPYPNAESSGILIGVLSVRNDIVADGQPLTNTDYAKFTLVSKFGESFGGTGGLSTTNLQQAYNNSTTPEILTNSTLGPLSLKNGAGTLDNVTNVFEGVNAAGTTTSYVRADGFISGNSLNAPNLIISGGTQSIFSGNSSSDLVRITQTGVGNSFVVDDSTNPDSTPFVINSGGSVSIGTTSVFSVGGGAETKLNVSTGSSGVATTGLSVSTPVIIESTVGTSVGLFSPDATNSQMYFGTPSDAFGAFLRWDYTNRNLILSTANGTGKLIFQTANSVEAARIDQSGNFGIGLTGATQKFEVSGNSVLNGSVTAGTTTINGNLTVTGNTNVRAFTGTTGYISGSGQNILTVIGSGNSTTSPLFTVQGSSGELFSVTDSLVGSLFSVNDISGLPILEVFSDNTTLMGSYLAPSLNTTTRVSLTAGTNTVYSIPTSAYTGAFIDYTLVSTGTTGARAGNIMTIWSGTTAQYTETSTNDIGTTTGVTFSVAVSGNNAVLSSSATTTGWTLKTIVRSI